MTKRSASPAERAEPQVGGEVPDVQDAPKGWREALERGAAQVASGQTVDGRDVLRRLDESIARLEAKANAARRR